MAPPPALRSPGPRRRLRAAVLAAASACLAALLLTAGSGGARARPVPASPPQTAVSAWTQVSYFNGIGGYLGQSARRFAAITTAANGYFGSQVSRLHKLHSRLLVLAYVNMLVEGSDTDPNFTRVLRQHPDWFLHDARGHLVTERGQPGKLLLDPANTAWMAYRAQQLTKLVDSDGYDGVMLDNVFPYINSLGDQSSANGSIYSSIPVDPRTGRAYTNAAWFAASLAFLRDMKTAVGRRLVIFNGLATGPSFFRFQTEEEAFLQASDGAIEEGFLRWGNQPIGAYPSPSVWAQDVRSIAAANSLHKIVVGWTDIFGNQPALVGAQTAAQDRAWELFSLSSYLLAAGGARYYTFRRDPYPTVQPYDSLYSLPIGRPTGNYRVQNGVYVRDFTNGRVLVNPAPGPSRLITLREGLVTPDGRRPTRLLLAGDTGTVLVRAARRP